MTFGGSAAGLWAAITGAGVLLLAFNRASVLLQRLTLSNALFGAVIAIFALTVVYRLMPIEVIVVLPAWLFFSPRVIEPTSATLVWSN
jgi:hypothetical protein